MSKQGKRYLADFKAKVVLELLEGDLTLNQIGSKYGITSKSLQAWKKTFLANAKLAFDVESAVSEYKTEIKEKEKEVNELHRQLGKRTAEAEWLSKKLNSLGSFKVRKNLIDPKHSTLPVSLQCQLLDLNRSRYYYEPVNHNMSKLPILRAIDEKSRVH